MQMPYGPRLSQLIYGRVMTYREQLNMSAEDARHKMNIIGKLARAGGKHSNNRRTSGGYPPPQSQPQIIVQEYQPDPHVYMALSRAINELSNRSGGLSAPQVIVQKNKKINYILPVIVGAGIMYLLNKLR